jgi:exosortase D (VPLPA-CTERM-specific)
MSAATTLGVPSLTPARWRIGRVAGGAFLLVVLLAGWPVRDALLRMFDWWLEDPEYSHGIIIPFVSAYLIWRRRDEIAELDFSGSWWGPAVAAVGFVLAALGEVSAVYPLIHYAFLIMLYGIVLSWTGPAVFRRLAMPLMMLLFMVPLPQFIVAMLSGELQLVSSKLGADLIRLAGVSVYLEGNIIDLGGYRLQVVEACAGLRYLFPLMTLGFIMAYMYRASLWKRLLLFGSSVPLTIVMNGLRIGIIGVTVDRWGVRMAEGMLHDVQGWMMFMLSAALMLAEVVVLNQFGRDRRGWREVFGLDVRARTDADWTGLRRIPLSFLGAAVLVVFCAAASSLAPQRAERIPDRRAFDELPMRLGDFTGKREALGAEFIETLQFDDYVLADFRRPSGEQVNLYISYYSSQRKGQSVHSPRTCIPGGGWQLRDFETVDLALRDGQVQRVNRAIIERGDERQLVVYWFKQRDRVVTNEWLVKWYLFADSLFRNRTDGAMVRLITPIARGGDRRSAEGRIVELMSELRPILPRYVPD